MMSQAKSKFTENTRPRLIFSIQNLMSMLIGRLAEDGFVALLQYFSWRNLILCKATRMHAYMSMLPAHLYKTEVRVEEGFEVTFGKLLSI